MTGKMDDRAAWVALALTPGIGQVRMESLLAACETAGGALAAPFAFLCAIPGISRASATAIRAASVDEGARVLEAVAGHGGRVLLPTDREFPPGLREIPDAPILLFARGNLQLLEGEGVAIVGSRDHTAYGAEACRSVVRSAVDGGLAVVSGMARGIDAIAHHAALDAGGDSVGVLGNGFGVVYPAANRDLYERMQREGLLLTEHSPGERPHAGTFPRRNRLISALARVTVVVEAALGSGALITAETALSQGRDVLAVPGPITSLVSAGTNRLLRDGAGPYLESADLFMHYPGTALSARNAESPAPAAARAPAQLPLLEARIWEALSMGPVLPDHLTETLGLTISDLLAALGALEIDGHVVRHPGNRFARA